MAHLNFKVPKLFKKEFCLFALANDYESQTAMLYAAFEALKQKYDGDFLSVVSENRLGIK